MSCRRIPCLPQVCQEDMSVSCSNCDKCNDLYYFHSKNLRNSKYQFAGSAASQSQYSFQCLPSLLPSSNCYCVVLNLTAPVYCRSSSLTACSRPRHSPLQRLFIVLLCAALCASARGCGPGRSFGFSHRRNLNHRPKPLVQKEHVPNIPEQTFAASGLTEGAIKRDTPKFRKLIWVESDYIVFKDEEGTGADRFMSRVN